MNKGGFLTLVIGPPATGKSTFIKELTKNKHYHIVYLDDIAQELHLSNCEVSGIPYSDALVDLAAKESIRIGLKHTQQGNVLVEICHFDYISLLSTYDSTIIKSISVIAFSAPLIVTLKRNQQRPKGKRVPICACKRYYEAFHRDIHYLESLNTYFFKFNDSLSQKEMHELCELLSKLN
jgi:tRNA uridine 5-carbamoylmethylation protein Kti12